MARGKAAKAVKSQRRSLSVRSGVLFPVARLRRYLKALFQRYRVGIGAPIYAAAVIEYLSAEVLELAGNAARDNKKKRISPRHILLAVANDDELAQFLKNVTFPQAGVRPNIRPELLGKKVPRSPKQAVKSMQVKTAVISPKKKSKQNEPKNLLNSKGTTEKSATDKEKDPIAGLTILSEKKLSTKQKVTVINSDILSLEVGALVHPTDSHFSVDGPLGKELVKKGGDGVVKTLEELLMIHGQLDPGGGTMRFGEYLLAWFPQDLRAEISRQHGGGSIDLFRAAMCSSTGSDLKSRYLVLVNPTATGTGRTLALLKQTVRNILALVDVRKMKTIAFPDLIENSGLSNKKDAAALILKTVASYFETSIKSSIEHLYFVLTDPETIAIYTAQLAHL